MRIWNVWSLIFCFSLLITGCSSSDSTSIDKLFGQRGIVLTSVPSQIITPGNLLKVDVNNVQDGTPGNDEGLSYTCTYDTVVDSLVTSTNSCASIPNATVTFNAASGIFDFTPASGALGDYDIKITATKDDLTASVVFPVSVRLNFGGITQISHITGTSLTLDWTPNLDAIAYQVFKKNGTGEFELISTVNNPAATGTVLNSLLPNTPYVLKVQALDRLGRLDGNTITQSATTTQLIKFSLASSATTATTGTAVTFTVQAYNLDDSPQTIGGIPLNTSITSGTSSGNFSTVTDNNDGTYTFTFTPTLVGTAITFGISTSVVTYFQNNTITLTVLHGAPSVLTSTINISTPTVVSANSVSVVANLRDAYNNPITSGVIAFSKSGGTSTGSFSAVNNAGGGVYSTNYTGLVAGTAQSVSVSIDGVPLAINAPIQVIPGAAVSANSTLTTTASSISSGTSATITATLRDVNNNLISSGVTVAFNKSGGTATGTLGSVSNLGSGQYSTTYSGIAAGTAQTISFTVDGAAMIPSVAIAVVPGAVNPANSSLTIGSNSISSGSFTTVTANLRDSNNNAVETGITVTFSKTGGTSTGTFNSVSNQGGGDYIIRYTGVVAGSAQTIAVLVNGSSLGLTVPVTVVPGAPYVGNSTITMSSGSISSGSTATATATIRDSNNNPIPSGITVTFSKTGGTATGTFSSVTNAGSGQYTIDYTGDVSGSAQTISTLIDGSAFGLTTAVAVVPGAPSLANSSISITSASISSGSTATTTVTIRDANNNPIPSGITVTFTKTGGTATGTFSSVTNAGSGQYTIVYTGVGAGTSQTISTLIGGSAFGLTTAVAVVPGAPSLANSSISITSSSISAGTSATVTSTIRDSNNNTIPSGITVTFSKSGGTSAGNFSAVTNAGSGQYTVDYGGLTAGSAQTISTFVDGAAFGLTTTVTVVPGSPNSVISTLQVSSGTVIAGNTVVVTATIKDGYNNPIITGLTVSFSKSSGAGVSNGTFSAVSNNGDGTYSATYTGNLAGTAQTLQTVVNLAAFGPTQTVQVLVGAPYLGNSSFNLSSSSIASAVSSTLTAVIRDSQNNPINTEYTIAFDAVGGSSTGTLSGVSNNGTGTFTATYTGVLAGSAQTLRVLSDGVPIAGLTQNIIVIPGSPFAGNSSFSIGSTSVQAAASSAINITLRDVNNNAISSGAVITFTKSVGGSDGTIASVVNNGSGNYSTSYTGVTQGAAQTVGLVVNGTSVGLTFNVTVLSGVPTHFLESGPTGNLNSLDCNGPYTLTFKDSSDNTTTSTSTVNVAFSSSPNTHAGTLYSDSGCTASISSLSIASGLQSATFYYKAYVPKSFTLTADPDLVSMSNATFAITNIATLGFIGGGAYFTMNGSGTNTVGDDSTGGFTQPAGVTISGNYMYVSDNVSHRILKFDLSTNTLVGWIGHVGSVEGISDYDGGSTCAGLSVASAALTPKWCVGGKANWYTANLINAPRDLASDSTYIYVSANQHRILRFRQSDGAFRGWFGRVNTTTGMSCALDEAGNPVAGTFTTGLVTPCWATGTATAYGSAQTGTGDGHFNGLYGLLAYGNYLYVADNNNNRIQRIDISSPTNPTPAGWIGQMGATVPTAGATGCVTSEGAAQGNATPGWCYGGVAQVSNRFNLAGPSPGPEVAAPNEGFSGPRPIVTDGTYLYIGDSANHRVSRVSLTTGAFNGYIGHVLRNSALSPTVPAGQASGTYSAQWTSGGVTTNSNSTNGFNSLYGMAIDATYLYITEANHRVSRIQISDGQNFRWIGRNNGSPTGGYTGCSSMPVGGTNPGWCIGGTANRLGNANGTFYTPYGIAIWGSKLLIADYSNFRVQRFDRTNGTFDGWIGTGNVPTQKWARSYPTSTIASRMGIDDYSILEPSSNWYAGITHDGTNLITTDPASARIKKHTLLDGAFIGYVGQIGNFPPTGPADCVGYTSGMTPTWCYGGGRTSSSGGIQGYNNPFSIATDGTYAYIASYSNHRVDRIRVDTGLYQGWIGRVLTVPTDGENPTACTSAVIGNPTPDSWCIGGTAQAGTTSGTFNAPRAVYYDSQATQLYVADAYGRLYKINPTTTAFTGQIGSVTGSAVGCTMSGNAVLGWCTSATTSANYSTYGTLNSPTAIGSNTSYVFVADQGTHRIQRYEKISGAPAGFIGGLSNTTGLNTASTTFSAGGQVTSNGCYNVTTGYSRGTPGWCVANSVGISVSSIASATTYSFDSAFNSPRGVWADDVNLYVADSLNNRIMKFNVVTGAFIGWKGYIASASAPTAMTCLSGTPVTGGLTPDWCTGGTPGPGKQVGAYGTPGSITGDANYIYVMDVHNNRIVTVPR